MLNETALKRNVRNIRRRLRQGRIGYAKCKALVFAAQQRHREAAEYMEAM